jgi:hypothetical protein
MSIEEFYKKYNGKTVDYDGRWAGQCWDLFQFYNRDVVGNPHSVSGNAWELYNKCPASYYTKVTTPKFGDVAVWKKSFGGYGHVAIVWDNGKFFSQNYPDTVRHTPSSLQTIPTNLIQGYLRPNKFMATYNTSTIRAEGTLARIGVSPLRYGYILRGKRFEYSQTNDVLQTIYPMEKYKIIPCLRISPADWETIPKSDGVKF